jgi:hypothetical protein
VGVCAAAADTRHRFLSEQWLAPDPNDTWRNGDCHAARQYRSVKHTREVIGMPHKRPVWIVWLLAACVLVLFPADALAAGNDVGKNVGDLLKHYAGEVYGGIVAIISLFFLVHRRYEELAVFLFASIVVAWMVFAPSEIAKAAEAIGKQVFG